MIRQAGRRQDDAKCADGQKGPVATASANVLIQLMGAARREDTGQYACDKEDYHLIEGASQVLVNGRPLVGVDHAAMHPHGTGQLIAGASNVLVGGATANLLDDTRADAISLVDKALESLDRWNEADRKNFREWFGDDSEEARQEMRQKYLALKEKLSRVDFDDTTFDGFAYVYKPGNTVHLGKAFWKAPRLGTDSKAGVLVHESSHFWDGANTGDTGGSWWPWSTVYGRGSARQLAKQSPSGARQNADNVEYFAETSP